MTLCQRDDEGSTTFVFVVSFVPTMAGNDESRVSPTVFLPATDLCSRTEAISNAIVSLAKAQNLITAAQDCVSVTATQLSRITGELDLSGLSLSTVEAADLAGLTGLTGLNLSNNQLTAVPGTAIGQLSSLTDLNLSDNSLATLPEDVLPAGLTGLDLSDNSLSSFPSAAISRLPRLTSLNLAGNSNTPYSIAYRLVRTGGSAGMATLAVQLPSYVPSSLR